MFGSILVRFRFILGTVCLASNFGSVCWATVWSMIWDTVCWDPDFEISHAFMSGTPVKSVWVRLIHIRFIVELRNFLLDFFHVGTPKVLFW